MSRILIVDNRSVFRGGMRELLEARIPQVHVVEAHQFGELIVEQNFDLVLIDFGSLEAPASAVLNRIRDASPTSRFAVMSTSRMRADVLNCLLAGFHGFVDKLQPDDRLIEAINDLLSGRIHVPSWLAVAADSTSVAPAANVEQLYLTPRQREILPLVARGMANKEVAQRLNIAEATTKVHMAALLRALGARNRTEAAFLAAKVVGSGSDFCLKLDDGGQTKTSMRNGLRAGSISQLREPVFGIPAVLTADLH